MLSMGPRVREDDVLWPKHHAWPPLLQKSSRPAIKSPLHSGRTPVYNHAPKQDLTETAELIPQN
jgi:hypothetical protein